MEFHITSFSAIILSLLCMVFLTLATLLNTAFALKTCDFPAIFNMGDSNSDTGTLSSAFTALNCPNGDTYFHMPVGRYSDGRLIIDFIAKNFNIPYLSAYLDSLGANFTHGADFAAAGATIRLPTTVMPTAGGYSPFYLGVQYEQFKQFKVRSQIIKKQGRVFAQLMPKEEYFRKALYTFDIGQNDLGAGIFSNMSVKALKSCIPDIVNQFSINVKNVYKQGARSFWIHNTGPIGCLAYVLSEFPSAKKDRAGCAKRYNKVAQYFNYRLRETVFQLRKEFPEAAFTYVDIYSVKYSLFSKPKKYGFELPLVGCCGYGGRYNYSASAMCGETVTVNGRKMVVGACDRPSVRVNWDGVHYTEAANKFVFDHISTGAFSDPPIPLNMACHRAAG